MHHSSVDLDWLSAVRLHPVNDALMRIAGALPVLGLGFAPVAVAGIAPVLTLMAILVHANLDWDWGPLRWALASPRFHRWHHTDEANARDKNFAGLLPLWDILFGTYYMPEARVPEQFGTASPVPAGLVGQMLYPFRRELALSPRNCAPANIRGDSPPTSQWLGVERVAGLHAAALEALLEPAHALLRGAVSEGLRHHAALRAPLQACRRRSARRR